ncbi:MAG TPA: hypothetical protein PKO33_05560 [Pyrinomonadaceae bacterium]|nr:hypothetical protein [Pyrinomonadaceae bacterium]
MKSLHFCLLAVFTLVFVLAVPSIAQTKKKTTRKPTSDTTVTQADLYKNQSQQIILGQTDKTPQTVQQQQVPETTDEKLDAIVKRLEELSQRLISIEAKKPESVDDKQRRLLLNLDILTRAEQRAETLRKQLYDAIEKESAIKTRLDQLNIDMRPEMIDRQVAFAGTLRPEELRDIRRKNLEAERTNLQTLLTDIQSVRSGMEQSVQRAQQLVDKLRTKLEKDIDDSLSDEPAQP